MIVESDSDREESFTQIMMRNAMTAKTARLKRGMMIEMLLLLLKSKIQLSNTETKLRPTPTRIRQRSQIPPMLLLHHLLPGNKPASSSSQDASTDGQLSSH